MEISVFGESSLDPINGGTFNESTTVSAFFRIFDEILRLRSRGESLVVTSGSSKVHLGAKYQFVS